MCAALAWRARSLPLGAVYAIGGAFFVFQPPILWVLGVGFDGRPPLLPDWLSGWISEIGSRMMTGPLNTVGMFSAALFVVGIVIVAEDVRRRRSRLRPGSELSLESVVHDPVATGPVSGRTFPAAGQSNRRHAEQGQQEP
jgi:hypothetical protein